MPKAPTSTRLAVALLRRLADRSGAEAVEPGPAELAAVAEALAAVVAAGERRWSPVRVAPEKFVDYLAERMPTGDTGPAAVPAQLAELQCEALYLACACVAGASGAVAAFEREFLDTAQRTLRGMDKTGTLADEAVQGLRRRLFVPERGRAPRIAGYLGTGDLRRWVRATAVRLGIDLLRASRRHDDGRQDDGVLAALPSADGDPELAHLRRLYGAELKRAFGDVLRARPAKQRAILRYHYVDGLNIEQIGAMFQVHKTTAYRWLERARSALVAETRAAMQRRLGVERGEIDSIMRLIHSRLDLSIRRALDSGGDPDEAG